MRVKLLILTAVAAIAVAGCNSFNRTEIHGSVVIGQGSDAVHIRPVLRGLRMPEVVFPPQDRLQEQVSKDVNRIISKWQNTAPPVKQVTSVTCTYRAPAWPDPPALPVLDRDTFDLQIETHLKELRAYIVDRRTADLKAQKDYRDRCGVK